MSKQSLMNFSITRKRNLSTLPVSSSFNNWLGQQEVNPSFVSYKSTKLTQASLFETVHTNPETVRDNQKESSQMRRTYSTFKNSQSRVSMIKDHVFDLSQQINSLKQKTKRTRLDLKLTSQQLQFELKQRQSEMKKNIQSLNKLAKIIIKGNQTRNQEIRNTTGILKQSYKNLRLETLNIHERLSLIEKECGFMTFSSKLKH